MRENGLTICRHGTILATILQKARKKLVKTGYAQRLPCLIRRHKPDPSRSAPLLSAVSISKRYGDFLANDGIDLDLFPAEIHALLGENGAGKSTLVKVMYGLIQPSGGELRWMGQKVVLAGPSEARALGIGMVFQHFSLFENLDRRRERRARPAADRVVCAPSPSGSRKLARVYGLPLDPKREVWRLSVGERQRIEIVRALMQNPKLLILDEPTVGADAAGGGSALRRAASGSRREGPRDPLHQPQARGGANGCATRRRSCAAARRSRPAIRAQETAASLARMMVGARDRRGEGGVGRARLGAAARHPQACRSSPTIRTARGSRTCRSRCAAARSSASPASPATVRTSCSPRCRASGCRPAKAPSSSTARPRACSTSTDAAAWAPPSCRRSGSATAPRRA